MILINILLTIALLWLGAIAYYYLSTKFEALHEKVTKVIADDAALGDGIDHYEIEMHEEWCAVNVCYSNNVTVAVKEFMNEDKEYALRCAEELYEKLNETI
jgi:hypothetical protein